MDLRVQAPGSSGLFYGFQFFDFALGIIGDDHFDWPQDSKSPNGAFVQVFTNGMLKDRYVSQADVFGYADVIGERANRFGCYPAAANAGNGW